ncbi:MAG: DUF4407 domain-containing protein [Chitinophagales bacterium]|nr:DUF4407 domain-containing protein [Chitinophagales bacterium]
MYTGYDIAPLYHSRTRNGLTFGRLLRMSLLFLLVLFMYGTLVKTPFFIYWFPIGLLILVSEFAFMIFYIIDGLMNRGKFNSFEMLLLLTVTFFPIYSGIVTWVYFGQPIIKGILIQKPWLEGLNGLVIFYMLKSRFITLYELRDMQLFYPFLTMPLYIIIILTFNPNKYAGTLFVYCNSVKGGCQFEFEIMALAFASIYFFIKFVRKNDWRYAVFWLLFFGYIFFINQKRGTSIALLGTYGLYALLNLKLDKIIFYALAAVTLIISGIVVLYLFLPDILDRIILQYQNVILVLMGQETGESSADARIRESMIAFKYFDKNNLSFIFGNGRIDTDWQSGPSAEFGHFYPSDLGMLGVIFQYGILGLLVGLMSYVMVLVWNRRIKYFQNDTYYRAIKYFILFYAVRGIPTGGNFFDPGTSIVPFFIAIFYFFFYMETRPWKQYSL